jgi:predicted CoA-binding protein
MMYASAQVRPAVGAVEIRDGLRTDMRYAVVAGRRDWGAPAQQHGDDAFFWGMLKPQHEAFKIAEMLRTWGATVYAVDPFGDPPTGIAGEPCCRSLCELPERVDCAVLSIDVRDAPAVLEDVLAAGIDTVWTQYSIMKAEQAHRFAERGLRVIDGCALVHWDVAHVSGLAKGRHICHIHAVLARAWRIRVDPQTGVVERLPPLDVRHMPWDRESYGAKLVAPNYPEREVLK